MTGRDFDRIAEIIKRENLDVVALYNKAEKLGVWELLQSAFPYEAEGESVLYTGDFRSNGRKSFDALLKSLPDSLDALLCEGTTLSRDGHVTVTERELEEQAVKLFRETTGPVFVLQSSMNIDRIVTMYRAAKRSGRIFLEETYMADVAAAAGDRIPNPAFDDVYAFISSPAKYDYLQ